MHSFLRGCIEAEARREKERSARVESEVRIRRFRFEASSRNHEKTVKGYS
jgi:hypothetical protein